MKTYQGLYSFSVEKKTVLWMSSSSGATKWFSLFSYFLILNINFDKF